MQRWVYILLIVLFVASLGSLGYFAFRKKNKPVQPPPTILPTMPLTPSATPTATATPAPTQTPVLLWGGPFPQTVDYMPRFEIVPGASWPILVGRPRDQVVTWLLTTYPTLTLRTVPATTTITYAARDDRITVAYDPYTRQVVSARIG